MTDVHFRCTVSPRAITEHFPHLVGVLGQIIVVDLGSDALFGTADRLAYGSVAVAVADAVCQYFKILAGPCATLAGQLHRNGAILDAEVTATARDRTVRTMHHLGNFRP